MPDISVIQILPEIYSDGQKIKGSLIQDWILKEFLMSRAYLSSVTLYLLLMDSFCKNISLYQALFNQHKHNLSYPELHILLTLKNK